MGTVSNLLAGTVVIYRGPSGEALPELDDLTPPAVTVSPGGNWVAEGFTMEDYELEYTPTFEPVKVNENNGPIKMVLVDEEASFRFTLSENDMTAWNHSINASTLTAQAAGIDVTAQDQLGVGDGSLTEYAYLLLGTSPEAGSRVIHIPKAVETGPVTFTFSKSHKPVSGIELTILNDTTQTAGERLFKVYDITAVASS